MEVVKETHRQAAAGHNKQVEAMGEEVGAVLRPVVLPGRAQAVVVVSG